MAIYATEYRPFSTRGGPRTWRLEISFGFVGIRAFDTKTLVGEVAGEYPVQFAEGVFGGLAGRVRSRRSHEAVRTEERGEGGRRLVRLQMVCSGNGVTGMALVAADFLLDLPEAGHELWAAKGNLPTSRKRNTREPRTATRWNRTCFSLSSWPEAPGRASGRFPVS